MKSYFVYILVLFHGLLAYAQTTTVVCVPNPFTVHYTVPFAPGTSQALPYFVDISKHKIKSLIRWQVEKI